MNVRSEIATSKRGRPPTEDGRRRILDAALRVFAKRGFHGTAVPLVAEAAGVGVGTLYRYFPSKELLVNEVFRDAKARLQNALLEDLDLAMPPRALFLDVWRRLVDFARAEPIAFQFLEMQDHASYMDEASREKEREVLLPMWQAGAAFQDAGAIRELPVEVLMALVWGALVGLLKAERFGYVEFSDEVLLRSGEACWDAIAAKPATNEKPKAKTTRTSKKG